MLIEILLSLILGILAGIITGLTPGIHINLFGAAIISLPLLTVVNPIFVIVFIVALSITHTFLDFIPSIFLGCPDTDTELSILPGHELLKKGRGYEAILLSNYGSLWAILVLTIIAYPSLILIQKYFQIISPFIPFLLILVSLFLILQEHDKINSTKIFLLSGLLGFIVLKINLDQSLFPLLTGLFGASSIIISIKNKTKIPNQIITKPKHKFKPILGAGIAAPICSFLPGLGSGQAAIIGNTITKTDKKDFLTLIGATNTIVMGFSFLSLYAIEKTRTGAALAIKEIIGELSPHILILVFAIILVVGIISYFLTKFLGKIISQKITKINYRKISFATLAILTAVVILVTGFFGLLIFAISTLTGIYSINSNVRRTNMMGSLLIPTIILLLS